MPKSTAPVTAASVRAYFRADAKRLDALSPEAQVTVREGARGRLHPEAVKAFNGKRAKARRYESGATTKATTEAKAAAAAKRESLRLSGVAVGKRGPLPKAALATPKA